MAKRKTKKSTKKTQAVVVVNRRTARPRRGTTIAQRVAPSVLQAQLGTRPADFLITAGFRNLENEQNALRTRNTELAQNVEKLQSQIKTLEGVAKGQLYMKHVPRLNSEISSFTEVGPVDMADVADTLSEWGLRSWQGDDPRRPDESVAGPIRTWAGGGLYVPREEDRTSRAALSSLAVDPRRVPSVATSLSVPAEVAGEEVDLLTSPELQQYLSDQDALISDLQTTLREQMIERDRATRATRRFAGPTAAEMRVAARG